MAYNSYTWHIQVIVKKDAVLPDDLKFRWEALTPGEGQNKIDLKNGDIYIKDFLLGKEHIQEIFDLVDASRAGLIDIKTTAEVRELFEADVQAAKM